MSASGMARSSERCRRNIVTINITTRFVWEGGGFLLFSRGLQTLKVWPEATEATARAARTVLVNIVGDKVKVKNTIGRMGSRIESSAKRDKKKKRVGSFLQIQTSDLEKRRWMKKRQIDRRSDGGEEEGKANRRDVWLGGARNIKKGPVSFVVGQSWSCSV